MTLANLWDWLIHTNIFIVLAVVILTPICIYLGFLLLLEGLSKLEENKNNPIVVLVVVIGILIAIEQLKNI